MLKGSYVNQDLHNSCHTLSAGLYGQCHDVIEYLSSTASRSRSASGIAILHHVQQSRTQISCPLGKTPGNAEDVPSTTDNRFTTALELWQPRAVQACDYDLPDLNLCSSAGLNEWLVQNHQCNIDSLKGRKTTEIKMLQIGHILSNIKEECKSFI